jgi:hypothetical protein
MDAVLKGLLAAGVLAVIIEAIITNVVASVHGFRARQRELKGLLRMLYVEIETNRGEAELLLSAENPQAGYWTNTVSKTIRGKRYDPGSRSYCPTRITLIT